MRTTSQQSRIICFNKKSHLALRNLILMVEQRIVENEVRHVGGHIIELLDGSGGVILVRAEDSEGVLVQQSDRGVVGSFSYIDKVAESFELHLKRWLR